METIIISFSGNKETRIYLVFKILIFYVFNTFHDMTKVKICAPFNDITMTLQVLMLQKYIEKPKTLIIKYKFMNNCYYLFFDI